MGLVTLSRRRPRVRVPSTPPFFLNKLDIWGSSVLVLRFSTMRSMRRFRIDAQAAFDLRLDLKNPLGRQPVAGSTQRAASSWRATEGRHRRRRLVAIGLDHPATQKMNVAARKKTGSPLGSPQLNYVICERPLANSAVLTRFCESSILS
jgi:hypothetical protein